MDIFSGDVIIEKQGDDEVMVLVGYFGPNIIKIMMNMLGGSKADAFYIDLYQNRISFLAYFAMEVYECLHLISRDEFYTNGLPFNRKVVSRVMSRMKETEHLKYIQHSDMDQDVIEEARRYSKGILDYGRIKKVMAFGILPHQEIIFEDYAYVKYINRMRGRLMAADPGTGKTFASLALSEALGSDIVIVIVPKGTIDSVWVDSLTGEMYKKPQPVWTSTMGIAYSGEKFIIIHYEFIAKLDKIIEKGPNKVAVIIDESQNVNEKGTTRDKMLTAFINNIDADDVILLSGTPIKGSPIETSNILKYCDKRFTQNVETVFDALYKSPSYTMMALLPHRYNSVNTFVSKTSMKLPPSETIEQSMVLTNGKYFTLDEITKRMRLYAINQSAFYQAGMEGYAKHYMIVRDRCFASALKDGNTTQEDFETYTENITTIIDRYTNGGLGDIPQVVRAANAYERSVLEPYAKKDLHTFREATVIIKYVSWKIQGEVLARVVMQTRIDLAVSMAEQLDYKAILTLTAKKVLVFSSYGSVCEAVWRGANKYTKSLRVYWEHTKAITQTVKAFHEDDKSQLMAVTYKSVSAGIPITVANLTVFMDLPFKAYVYGQAIARTHRLGQDTKCTFLQLLLDTGEEPNINSRNIDIIQMSKDMVEAITQRKVDLEFKHNPNLKDGDEKSSDTGLAMDMGISDQKVKDGVSSMLADYNSDRWERLNNGDWIL